MTDNQPTGHGYQPQAIEPKWRNTGMRTKPLKRKIHHPNRNFMRWICFRIHQEQACTGHPEGYTATDIVSRYKRMRGYNVLHPMGWDAFGLPAEQYAMDTGKHPREFTVQNIDTFRRQIKSLGFV